MQQGGMKLVLVMEEEDYEKEGCNPHGHMTWREGGDNDN
jgi:hypothetical protein